MLTIDPNRQWDPADPCKGCGECCTHVGTPPGYALFYPPPGVEMISWAKDSDDWLLFQAMSPDARAELDAYYAAKHAGLVEDRTREDQPCLWFDLETRRCRNYHDRPTVCRDFEPGSDYCGDVKEGRSRAS